MGCVCRACGEELRGPVTGVTISAAQFEAAKERVSEGNTVPGSVKLFMEDYRELEGQYDKIVSIEMFEAVGLAHYDDFSGHATACSRLMVPC